VTGPLRVGVLASGAGTNLQALLDSLDPAEARVVAVASDVAGASALGRAEAAGLPSEVFPLAAYRDRASRDAAVADWLEGHEVKLVVLAGYMALLTPAFLARFPEAVINVHPALLPAFPGLDAIGQALRYGVKVFGVTVHFVDEGVDTGPVILQRAIDLPEVRSEDEVRDRLRPLEHSLLPTAVSLIARGAVSRDPQDGRRVVIAP
jgi:phosphoribosylglycinamide formyltransferase-1